MNVIRTWTFGLAAAMVAASAIPSYAAQSQNKTYALTVTLVSADTDLVCQQPTGAPTPTIQIRVLNTSPIQSNSTINSVDLFPDLNWSIGAVSSVCEASQPGTLYQAITSGGHIRVGGLSPIKPKDSLIVNFSTSQSSCGDANWLNSQIWTGSNLGGNTFTPDLPPKSSPVSSVACGSVACDGAVTGQPTSDYCSSSLFQGAECVSGNRGPYNKDGSCGTTSVPVFISTYLQTDTSKQKVHFRWPVPDPAVNPVDTNVFTYTINTPGPSPADFSWIDDTSGNPIAVPSTDLRCNARPAFLQAPTVFLDTDLPQPIGLLTADVNASKTKLDISSDASVTAPPEFSIVIGTEMMRVTKITNGNWTVIRGYGKTTAAPHSVANGPLPVMYSPLPIIPNKAPFNTAKFAHTPYAPDNHAHMCWTANGLNDNGLTYFTDVIDIGDGWVLGR